MSVALRTEPERHDFNLLLSLDTVRCQRQQVLDAQENGSSSFV